MKVSVSLRSYIHSYSMLPRQTVLNKSTFPSPYGVSFILIWNVKKMMDYFNQFPSPYGVIFILTRAHCLNLKYLRR